jgi:RHS repeat-associated protein
LLAFTAVPALALEANQTFEVHKADGGLVGAFPTQEAAEAAIRTIPGPSNAPDAYQYVTEMKSAVPSADGMLTITYWMGKKERAFLFIGINGTTAETEEELNLKMVAALNQGESPPCASATVARTGEWHPYSPDYEGIDAASYEYTGNTFDEIDGNCYPYGASVELSRVSICPNPYMHWSDSQDACINEEIFATVVTKQLQCDSDTGSPTGLVGNPCDVKTGDKFETEDDFDLGWIKLSRYYHSALATSSGRWGPGWTDDHQLRLSITPVSTISISGNGYITPFVEIGGDYFATNGSGQRLTANGNGWRLYSGDGIYSFNAQGQLTRRDSESGDVLIYGHDAKGRLSSISSAQGRSIQFAYLDDSTNAYVSAISSAGSNLASYAYDNGRLISVTFADGKSRHYHYEDARFSRHLTGTTSEAETRFSYFAYDDQGRVTSSKHAGDVDATTLAYSNSGTIVTNPPGEVATYGLTSVGGGTPKISSILNSAGTEQFTYLDANIDYRRRLSSIVDRRGVVTKHSYAELTESGVRMEEHTVQEAFGLPEQRTTITRTAADSNTVLFMQSDRLLVAYARNARLQPTSITATDLDTSEARVTALSYCEAADVAAAGSSCPILGLLKSLNGPRTDVNDITQYAYYSSDDTGCGTAGSGSCGHRKGDLWKVTDALGYVTETLAYDAVGRVLSVRDPNATVTDYTYSPRGWLTSVKVRGTNNSSEADDRITLMEYWPTGQVKKITQPDGAYTTYTYDAAQRLTDIADNDGNSLHYTLDNAGNRLAEETKDAGGTLKRTLSRIFNQLGQLATQADASANPTDFGYDANGNNASVTDALGRTSQSDYDPFNRLKRTLQDVGGIAAETKFTYDAVDNLTQVTDPKGLKTTYTYNGLGDLTKQVSPDTGTTLFTYDSAGNRATQKDARSKTTTYSYDALNRLVGLVYPNTTYNTTYTYDTTQGICTAAENFSMGRLTKMQDGSGTTQYCYNRFGDLTRKVQTTNGVALSVLYGYASGGQLTSMTYPDGAVVDYVRDNQGRITEVGVKPNGGVRQVLLTGATYHPFGPVTGWTYGNGRQLTRTLDLDYRPIAIHDGGTGGLSVGFSYDEVGNLAELSQAGSALPEVAFGYDALGRLTQFKDGPTGMVIDGYGYDKTGNRISQTSAAGTTTYTYPATSHRLSSVGAIPRSYDAAGNNIKVAGSAKEFLHDDTGRLSSIKVSGATTRNYRYNAKGERVRSFLSTSNTYTLYDEAGHWLGDYGANGVPIQQAIWMDDLPVGLRTSATGNLTYVEPDHLGSPRVVIDPVANNAIWKWDLKGEAFGSTAPEQDPDGNGTSFVLDMRFPGQRYDSVSGLNYNYFRDYDPSLGRYSQADPLGLNSGFSAYSYVDSDPLSYIDAYGLQTSAATATTAAQYSTTTTTSIGLGARPNPFGPGFLSNGKRDPLYVGRPIHIDLITPLSTLIKSTTLLGALSEAADEGHKADDCPVEGTVDEGTTKGNTNIRRKPGGTWGDAQGDFWASKPEDVSQKPGGVLVGTLPGGRTIVARPYSGKGLQGPPTVEIQRGGRIKVKVRYGD